MILIIFILFAFLSTSIHIRWKFKFWNKFQNVQILNWPTATTIGNYISNWRLSSHILNLHLECRARNWQYVGHYLFTRPLLVIADPVLLKEIVVKRYTYFQNRGSYHNDPSDLTNRNIFNMQALEWCQWQKILARCFSSPKLSTYLEVFQHFIRFEHLEGADIDFFKLTNTYTFGVAEYLFLGVNKSCGQRDAYQRLRNIFRPSYLNRMTDVLGYYVPYLLRFFNCHEFPKAAFNYARQTLNASLEKNELPVESMPKQLKDMQDEHVLNQDLIVGVLCGLFIGGLKSTTPFLTYACFELAKSPRIQNKLRAAILESYSKHESFSFNALQEITYLQQVLDETMRLYNGGPLLIRECNDTCKLDSNGLLIEKGVLVVASLRGMLMDPEYFERPTEFIPERFEKRENITAFLPFGLGRHTCIGNKFALLQAKLFLANLLFRYEITPSESTKRLFTDKGARLADNQIFLNVKPL